LKIRVFLGVFTKKICHTLATKASPGSTKRLEPMTMFESTSKFATLRILSYLAN
jgi:hypothetical protein